MSLGSGCAAGGAAWIGGDGVGVVTVAMFTEPDPDDGAARAVLFEKSLEILLGLEPWKPRFRADEHGTPRGIGDERENHFTLT